MAIQTLKITTAYKTDTEEEAIGLIEDAKDNQVDGGYSLTKSGYVMKTKKSKGEIIEVTYRVTLEKSYE